MNSGLQVRMSNSMYQKGQSELEDGMWYGIDPNPMASTRSSFCLVSQQSLL